MTARWLWAVPTIGLWACTSGIAGPDGVSTGRYEVTLLVNDGRVIEGHLDLVIHADSSITGTKSLNLIHGPGAGSLEPLLEGGDVSGRLEADRVVLQLNPHYADHNFTAGGTPDRDRITGLVTHVGIVGAVEEVGTFEAHR
jgi:hypothetical protein